MSILNIAIVGFGWVARDYMYPAIQACPLTQLAAVCSPNPADLAALPETVACYDSLDAMLQDRLAIDAVYIATPNYLHREQTEACLAAGLHVLCEKPLATTLEDAQAMLTAAQASQQVYATAYDQRFHPAHQAIRTEIQAGTLGTLTQVKIDYACWLPVDWVDDNWRIEQHKAGGGAIIDLAPHGLDLIETLLDDRVVECQLLGQTAVHAYPVDDGGVLMAKLTSGVLATLHVGYNRPDAYPRRRLEIIGTQQMLVAKNTMGQDPGGEVTLINTQGQRQALAFDTQRSPFLNQITAFADNILQHTTPIRQPEDDLRLYALLDHALQTGLPLSPTPMKAAV